MIVRNHDAIVRIWRDVVRGASGFCECIEQSREIVFRGIKGVTEIEGVDEAFHIAYRCGLDLGEERICARSMYHRFEEYHKIRRTGL